MTLYRNPISSLSAFVWLNKSSISISSRFRAAFSVFTLPNGSPDGPLVSMSTTFELLIGQQRTAKVIKSITKSYSDNTIMFGWGFKSLPHLLHCADFFLFVPLCFYYVFQLCWSVVVSGCLLLNYYVCSQGRSQAWAWGGLGLPANKNIAPPNQMKPISHFGLALVFIAFSILYLTSWKRPLQADFFFAFKFFWLKLQPKLAPPNQKSWLRPCL